MNVYDFDGTIRRGDTTADFFFFEMKRHPWVFFSLPRIGWAYLMHKVGRKTLGEFKTVLLSFMKKVDTDKEIELFAEKNTGCIDEWYMKQTDPSDVIITASPEILVAPLCAHLGVTVMGTPVDKSTGMVTGENCKGEEKVRRFKERFGDDKIREIDNFYSDSHSDDPLAALAKHSFLVTKSCKLKNWDA